MNHRRVRHERPFSSWRPTRFLAALVLSAWAAIGGATQAQTVDENAPPDSEVPGMFPPQLSLAPPMDDGEFENVRAGDGLQVSTGFDWAPSPGYRPMRLRIQPDPDNPPETSETRFLRLEVRLRRREPRHSLTVVRELELPADSPLETTVLLPRFFTWNAVDVNLYEQGRLLEEASQQDIGELSSSNEEVNQHAMLVARPGYRRHTIAFADRTDSTILAIRSNLRTRIYERNIESPHAPLSMVESPVERFPDSWLGYTAFDLVLLELDDAWRLHDNHPARWKALVRWLWAGGNVFVAGVGDDFGRLGDVERLFDLPASRPDIDYPATFSGWRTPPTSLGKETVRILLSGSVDLSIRKNAAIIALIDPSSPVPKPPPMSMAPGVWRHVGLGSLSACKDPDFLHADSLQWAWMVNAIEGAGWTSLTRNGVSCTSANPEFYNWLVPGVGRAPTGLFLGLISLYAVGLGPVAYFLLRRRHKLYLMLLLAPGGAGLMTLGLVAYAVFGEGFATRVRVRSYTYLDQRTGQAACWSRLSYFSGMAPSDGLSFSDDVAFLPVELADVNSANSPNQERRLIWQDGEQKLTAGWLDSRVSMQSMTVRSRTSDIRVRFASGNGGQTLSIENRLGARVRRLVTLDRAGRCFTIDDLANDETREVQGTRLEDALDKFRTLIQDRLPERPEGVNVDTVFSSSLRLSDWLEGRARRSGRNRPGNTSFRNSVLEREITAAGEWTAEKPGRLAPGTFAAILDASPETELGVAGARPETDSSLHVIFGTW